MIAELFRDHSGGQFGGIAVATDVAQDYPDEIRAGDPGDEFSGLVVREMAVAVADPLLGGPGAFRVILEQDLVVIGLGEKGVGPHEPLNDHALDMAHIAEDPEAVSAALEMETDRINSIVRNGKGADCYPVNLEGRPGVELFPGDPGLDRFPHDSAGMGRRVDRELAVAAENINAAGVVAVFVGENDSGEALGVHAEQF